MAEWMHHGPKDIIEIDDDIHDMSERELSQYIHSQLEFCKSVFGHLTSSYRRLIRPEKKEKGG